jgi:hypothetical protein
LASKGMPQSADRSIPPTVDRRAATITVPPIGHHVES